MSTPDLFEAADELYSKLHNWQVNYRNNLKQSSAFNDNNGNNDNNDNNNNNNEDDTTPREHCTPVFQFVPPSSPPRRLKRSFRMRVVPSKRSKNSSDELEQAMIKAASLSVKFGEYVNASREIEKINKKLENYKLNDVQQFESAKMIQKLEWITKKDFLECDDHDITVPSTLIEEIINTLQLLEKALETSQLDGKYYTHELNRLDHQLLKYKNEIKELELEREKLVTIVNRSHDKLHDEIQRNYGMQKVLDDTVHENRILFRELLDLQQNVQDYCIEHDISPSEMLPHLLKPFSSFHCDSNAPDGVQLSFYAPFKKASQLMSLESPETLSSEGDGYKTLSDDEELSESTTFSNPVSDIPSLSLFSENQ